MGVGRTGLRSAAALVVTVLLAALGFVTVTVSDALFGRAVLQADWTQTPEGYHARLTSRGRSLCVCPPGRCATLIDGTTLAFERWWPGRRFEEVVDPDITRSLPRAVLAEPACLEKPTGAHVALRLTQTGATLVLTIE